MELPGPEITFMGDDLLNMFNTIEADMPVPRPKITMTDTVRAADNAAVHLLSAISKVIPTGPPMSQAKVMGRLCQFVEMHSLNSAFEGPSLKDRERTAEGIVGESVVLCEESLSNVRRRPFNGIHGLCRPAKRQTRQAGSIHSKQGWQKEIHGDGFSA